MIHVIFIYSETEQMKKDSSNKYCNIQTIDDSNTFINDLQELILYV